MTPIETTSLLLPEAPQAPLVIIDVRLRKVRDAAGRPLAVTLRSLLLLWELARNEGHPVTFSSLIEGMFNRPLDGEADMRLLTTHVYNLRKVMPRDQDGDSIIRSWRGVGYWVLQGIVAFG